MSNSSSISLGFSPCPNDTFIFDAFIHQKIKSEFSVNVQLLDVETLNLYARKKKLDITKLSFNAFGFVSADYQILSSGSALGRNCGPMLISKKPIEFIDLKNCRVAIPGKYTTANLLLTILAPDCRNKIEMVFSDIEDAVLNDTCDVGLIIHENRFTYQSKGLKKVADLGELWEKETRQPIPLGCIAVKRSLPEKMKLQIADDIKRSVEFAFLHPDSSADYVQQHAQEMSRDVQHQHIQLYVNKFSIDLGEEGKQAVRILYRKGQEAGLLPTLTEPIFVEE